MEVAEGGGADIWVYDPQRDAMTRLTFGGGVYDSPTWSPDGEYIVFYTGEGISQTRADGSGQPQVLMKGKPSMSPGSFTPDGKRLAYWEGSSGQIWTVPVENQDGRLRAGRPEQFLKSSFDEGFPEFSPDGRWLAYHSNESGNYEVYVRAFPPPASGQGGKWQVSNNGGGFPRWAPDGHELMYQSDDQIMSASYAVKGDAFVAETPRVWIAKLGAPVIGFRNFNTTWDLAPDGKRALVLTLVEAPKEHEIVVLLNFFDELRRKVPVGK